MGGLMGKTTWTALRDLLAERYDEFRTRLARRLGSEELASESLNETWLRLHRQDDAAPIQSPSGYVLRTAFNIATDRRRMESRRARRADLLAAFDIPDPAPDQARELEARLQLQAIEQAIQTLPVRTRDILIAARVQGLPQQDIANRFDISPRMIRIELRRALDHCEAHLEKNTTRHFLPGSSQTSMDQAHDLPSTPVKPKQGGHG
ncbi:RNA polymerase sigma factor [Bradyrhizobium sp. LHD-71]|uniref:RNA polymerase sigma factor n=1 Tax=Bradyrhizobium sp. LHD-71 TaxID=3072141 RepID=UPI00280EC70D|nr:RNA polymerase sigma factor [Bradyrhizobium sp. LHD-71]MDQ8731538.1 RNA polymerase sigma factor [Bradyrhizobium sp. LHD-71]